MIFLYGCVIFFILSITSKCHSKSLILPKKMLIVQLVKVLVDQEHQSLSKKHLSILHLQLTIP